MYPLINRLQPSMPRINLKHIFTLFTDTYAIVIGIQRKQGANWNVDIWIVGYNGKQFRLLKRPLLIQERD